MKARLFVDHRPSALEEAGDFLLARADGAVGDDHIAGELGQLLTSQVPGRQFPPPTSRSSSPWVSRSRTWPRPTTSTRRRGAQESGSSWSSEEAATTPIERPGLEAIRAARARIAGSALRNSLCSDSTRTRRARSSSSWSASSRSGPSRSAAAANAMGLGTISALSRGVWTASAGNMAQGVAWGSAAKGHPLHRRRAGQCPGHQARGHPRASPPAS